MAGIRITLEVDDKGTAKITGFSGAIKKAESATDVAAKRMQSDWKKLGNTISGLHNRIKRLATSLPAMLGMAGVGAGMAKLIKMSSDQEDIFRKLQTAVEITGVSYDAVKPKIDEFLSSMQASTRFGDTNLAPSLQMITQLTGSLEKGFEGAKLAADIASSGLFDLSTASKYVAMAMSGEVTMLGRYIPELRSSAGLIRDNMSASEKWAVAQKILTEKFGGSAQKDLLTFSGALKQFRNYIGDILERIGDIVTKNFAGKIREWTAAVREFIKSGKIEAWAIGATEKVKKFYNVLAGGFKLISDNWDIISSLGIAVSIVVAGIKAWAAAQWALNAALTANPIGLIITGIGALIAAIIYVVKKTVGWAAVFELVGKAAKTFWEVLKALGGAIKDWIFGVSEWFSGFGKIIAGVFTLSFDKIKEGFEEMKAAPAKFLESVKDRFTNTSSNVVNIWKKTTAKLEEVAGKAGEDAGKKFSKGFQTGLSAGGGIAPMPTVSGGPRVPTEVTPPTETMEPMKVRWDDYINKMREAEEVWIATHEIQWAATQALVEGVQTAWDTILEADMTGAERRRAIWENMKQTFLAITGDMLAQWAESKILELAIHENTEAQKTAATSAGATARNAISAKEAMKGIGLKVKETALWIAQEIKKTAVFMAQSAMRIAAMTAEIAKSLAAAAAKMVEAAAEVMKWSVSKLGPLGLALGAAGVMLLVAQWSKIKKSFGFAEGGLVDLQRSGLVIGPGGRDNVPIWATRGEYVVRREVVQQVGVRQLDIFNATGRMPGSMAPTNLTIQGDTIIIQGGADEALVEEIQEIKNRSREELARQIEDLIRSRRLQL